MGKTWPALEIYVPGCDPVLYDLVAAELDDFQPTAIQELDDASTVRAFFVTAESRRRAAERLARSFGIHLVVNPVDVEDEDWAARSQKDLRAIQIGRVTVSPPWDVRDVEHGAISVLIEPSTGFGTGHHATTRLMLRALQSIDIAGSSVIDVGTGSGVLAIAAVALGAVSALGIDVDPDALQNAVENANLNGMSNRVRFEERDLQTLQHSANVVLANLTGGLILKTSTILSELVAPGGYLIASGFMQSDVNVVPALEKTLTIRAAFDEDEWRCVVLSR